MDILIRKYFIILLMMFAIYVDNGTQVAVVTPQTIRIQRRRWAISDPLPEMFHPLVTRTPLVEESCIWWEVYFWDQCRNPLYWGFGWQRLNLLPWFRIFMGTYRKMYGEDVFVCQSVWSRNEDDVFLSNKSNDVMDLDALSEDINSSMFPDEDE